MNAIAEFRVPAENFALAATLAASDVNLEAERVTAYDTDRAIPLLWATGSPEDIGVLDRKLDEDPSVENAELVTDLDGERLYRTEWIKESASSSTYSSRRTRRFSVRRVRGSSGASGRSFPIGRASRRHTSFVNAGIQR